MGPGGLNLLINNAAILFHGTIQSTSPEDMLTTFNTNVVGPMSLTKVREEVLTAIFIHGFESFVPFSSKCIINFVCNI